MTKPHENPRDLYNCKFLPPSASKNLRACLRCSLVKTEAQFLNTGCENCPALGLQGAKHRIEQKTTTIFSGVISLMNPEFSWVAKWMGLSNKYPGCYCIEKRGGDESDYEEDEFGGGGMGADQGEAEYGAQGESDLDL